MGTGGKRLNKGESGIEVIAHDATVEENSMQTSLDLVASTFRTALRLFLAIGNFPYLSTGRAFKHP